MNSVTRPGTPRVTDVVVYMFGAADTQLKPMARLALLLLAYYMWQVDTARGHDRYAAFPGLERLARQMGCARNTAKKALRELRERGLLTIETGGKAAREVKGRRTRTHIFRLGPEVMRVVERRWPDPVTGAAPRLRVMGE